MKKIFLNIMVMLCAVFSLVGLTACSDNGEYDSITKKCSLTKAYSGKDFISDGIGEATLLRVADGDTATFKLSSGENVTIRFHGIDTPESTGSVEKWGKAASEFTKGKLGACTSFVLQATATPAEVDSYGVRYLGYVWYKLNDEGNWLNLNLQIVENGYSSNKCVQGAKYPFYTYFKEAEEFAREKELHIWGNEEDPYYTTEAIETTIQELNENPEAFYNEEQGNGSKVRIKAFVVGVEGTSTFTFRVGQIIDGKVSYFNIYAGYTSSGIPKFLKIGTEYSFTGTMQLYDHAYQISGLTYVPLQTGGDYLYATKANYYCTFDSSIAHNDKYAKSLHSDVTVKEATVTGTNLKIVGTTYSSTDNQTELTYTFNVPVSSGFNASNLVGKKFSTVGYQDQTGVFTILNYSDIRFR